MSAIGWVDFSSEDRDKVQKVLAAAREPGTLDELGIGQIRDAYANTLFPGISTIQTRAKYFVLIPRLLREIESGAVRAGMPSMEWLEQQENRIAQQLVERHGSAESGIIGSESIHKGGVRRHPSSIYWNGLKVLGIVHTGLSLKEFCARLARNDVAGGNLSKDQEEGLADGDLQRRYSPVELPCGQEQWRKQLSINLTPAEATSLRNKFIETERVRHSVLSQLLQLGGLANLLAVDGDPIQRLPELHFDNLTELLLATPEISARCQDTARQARAFGWAIQGAHIRYNYELARSNGHEDYTAELEGRFAKWREDCARQQTFSPKCVEEWLAPIADVRINTGALKFIRDWCRLIYDGAPVEALDRRVAERAKQTKGQRSQLFKKRRDPGWVGIDTLDYRWGVARVLLRDIEEACRA